MSKLKLFKKDFQELSSHFDLGVVRSFRRFSKGKANTNYFFSTTKGSFVCKIYHALDKDVYAEFHLLESVQPFPVIRFLSVSGDPRFYIKNNVAVVYSFIEGEQVNKPSSSQISSLMRTLAKLHLASDRVDFSKCIRTKYSKRSCFSSARRSVRSLSPALARQRLAWLRSLLDSLSFSRSLPQGIIHGDYSQENILFQGDTISCILDFDGSGHGVLISDIACAIYFWAWFKEPARRLNLKKAKILIQEYELVRSLTIEEKNCLYDALVLRTAMYFVLNIAEVKPIDTSGRSYHDFFKSIVGQVTSVGRENFYRALFD